MFVKNVDWFLNDIYMKSVIRDFSFWYYHSVVIYVVYII